MTSKQNENRNELINNCDLHLSFNRKFSASFDFVHISRVVEVVRRQFINISTQMCKPFRHMAAEEEQTHLDQTFGTHNNK